MPGAAALVADWSALVIAGGVAARFAVVTALASLPAFPGVAARVRGAVALAIAVAAWPAAVQSAAAPTGAWPLVILGEAFVGLVIGAALAAVVAAAGWAGDILGSASGLSWADDFAGEPAAASAGIGRLAWWVGAAAFLAAGGGTAIVAGLVDSVQAVPVGSVLSATETGGWPPKWLVSLAVTAPTVALSLAVTLAVPALTAVVTFHLASAICLRAVPFAPGAGMLQGLAALVLLAALTLGLDTWATGCGTLMHAAIEKVFK